MKGRTLLAWALLAALLGGSVLASLVLIGTPACSADRVESLQRGLSRAEGFAAGVHGTPREAKALRNVQATRDALLRCGVES